MFIVHILRSKMDLLVHFFLLMHYFKFSIVFTHGVRMGGQREKVCSGCISETVRCRKLILGRHIG